MRLFEASHVPEILREAGPDGLHVEKIAERNGVDASKLGESRSHHIITCFVHWGFEPGRKLYTSPSIQLLFCALLSPFVF